MNQPANPNERLAALGARLAGHPFKTDLTLRGLAVRNLAVPACCEEAGSCRSLLITCRPRPEDGNRLWFFSGWGEAISPAENLTDAFVYAKGWMVMSG